MKKLSILLFAILVAVSNYAQETQHKFEVKLNVGPSFLSYGDLWGVHRGMVLQYGNLWFVRFEYNYSNYEASSYSEEFYQETQQITTQTKYLNNFIGPSSPAEYEFGFLLLDVKDEINTIDCYQLAAGRKIFIFKNLVSVSLKGNIGMYKLTTVAPSITIRPLTISNPSYYKEDVTLIGTFTNSFLDFNWGFGTEFEYEILQNRLSFNLFANATLGDVRFFGFGLGSSIKI